jgi:thioesterase domain-containing protein
MRIRRLQPIGPYFLAGQCFGGRVAYEMARQLEAAGERIGLLLLLDASPPFFTSDGRRRREIKVRRSSRWRFLAEYAYDRLRQHATTFMQQRGAKRRAFVRKRLGAIRDIVITRDVFRGNRSRFARRAVYSANIQAGRHYVPGPFGGPVVLYLTRDRAIRGVRNFRLDWLKLVPQIGAPLYGGGRHTGDMLNPPHVYELAAVVNSELEAAYAKEETVAREEARAIS